MTDEYVKSHFASGWDARGETLSTRAKSAHLAEMLEMEREHDPVKYAAMVEGARLMLLTFRETIEYLESIFNRVDRG